MNDFFSNKLTENSTAYTITGKVVDKDNNGIQNAQVSIGNNSVLTDSSGNYTLTNIKSGKLKIECKKDAVLFVPEKGSDELFVSENVSGFNFNGFTDSYIKSSIDSDYTGNLTYIYEVQGKSHTSIYKGLEVKSIVGIVTDFRRNKYYTSINGKGQYVKELFVQSPFSDLDYRTSDGVKVITSDEATIAKGDLIYIKVGYVEESQLNKSVGESKYTENLNRTQIKASYVDGNLKVLKSNFQLPPPVLIGEGGRIPPNKEYSSTNFTVYNPDRYGLDFWESLEGMRVKIQKPTVVGPTSNVTFSDEYAIKELYVVCDKNKYGDNRSIKNGLVIGENYSDFNPDIITLAKFNIDLPDLNVGDTFNGDITGVVDYSYKKYKVQPTENLPSYTTTTLREISRIKKDEGNLLVASYNIENYTLDSAENGDSSGEKTLSIAQSIVNNLKTPDIVSLIEVQDDSGARDDGIVSSVGVLSQLTNKIKEVTNNKVNYKYIYISPIYGTEGGEPVGNIRNALLYNPDRVTFIQNPTDDYLLANSTFKDSLSTTSVDVVNENGKPKLTLNPGRVDPLNPDFSATRKTLACEFIFKGEKIFVLVNHFSAKGGDNPLQGNIQPPVRISDDKRKKQAEVVRNFINKILSINKNSNVLILGDYNDFHFSDSLKSLNTNGLYNLIYDVPLNRRYSYNYEGNSQILDNVIVSENLKKRKYEIDIVHINSDFHFLNRNADHDPVLYSVYFDNSNVSDSPMILSSGYPQISSPNNTALVKFKSSNSGRVYYYAVKESDNYNYTINDIIFGKLSNGSSIQRNSIFLTENFESQEYIRKLVPLTNYKLLYVLESLKGLSDGKLYTKSFTTGGVLSINYAFTDSDFENDIHNTGYALKPSETKYIDNVGYEESRCMFIKGSETANYYVFTAKYNLNPKGSYTKLTMLLKGQSDKSLLLQFKSGGVTKYFNFGSVTGSKTITSSGTASYTGTINCPSWVKISMDISGVTLDSDPISIKGGSSADYEIYIDNIAYE